MRWIKASDVGENRRQEKYCGRILEGGTINYGQFFNYDNQWRDQNFLPLPEGSTLEILDETPGESEAVEFAEWAGTHLWNYMRLEQVWTNEENFDVLTTKELYQLFKQQP